MSARERPGMRARMRRARARLEGFRRRPAGAAATPARPSHGGLDLRATFRRGLAALLSGSMLLAQAAPVPDVKNRAGESLAALGHDPYGDQVRAGYLVFTDTPANASRYSGNALSCGNCHLDAGTRTNAAPMSAAWGMYPAYSKKADRVLTFAERVQSCFVYSLNGFAPALDSPELRAVEAYSAWLAKGTAVGVDAPGRGFVTIARTGADANALRGREVFQKRCAACHGNDGAGTYADGKQVIPPLWGLSSFNKGAGMAQLDLLAGFVKANMPLGEANLSDQDALDVSAWILRQNRWRDPRRGLIQGLLSP